MPSAVDDGPSDETDWVAPYLGLSRLDAEDLQLDAEEAPEKRSHLPQASPFWARLLPDLSLAVQFRTTKELAGAALIEPLRAGFIFIAVATFPLPDEPLPAPFRSTTRAGAPHILPVASGWEEPPPTDASTALADPGEPSVQELQRAAEHASVPSLSDVAGWAARARASAMLPELTLDYRRNVGEIDTLGIRSDLGIDSHDVEDITRYGARATWQLSQLVFNREEINAAQTADAIERGRRELLLEVARVYFHRQALQRELVARPAPDSARRFQIALDIAQTGAELDALTGGYLSRQLAGEVP